ncbi:hypothetical protein [Cetobacterium sp.]|uniref:hypothetical protein n=1 Tax=Cetobacterium sp. TaxID=2071632 RepID=UPI003F2C7C37
MKKVLFGILALSMTAFAANPGVDNTASVPVKVIAEIITAPTGLTITDEAGTVLDELLLDHGRIIKGAATSDSVAYKLFKVQRFVDGSSAAFGIANGTLEVKLTETGAETETAVATLKKNGTLIGTNQTLTSALSLSGGSTGGTATSYTQATTKDDTEHVGRVTSVISQSQLVNGALETGIFHNARANTLTVVYTPQ